MAWIVACLVLCLPASSAPSDEQDLFSLSLEELTELRVTSASRLEESVAEAPVPVTVVTAEMIRRSGARSLKDVLITFVPGMTFVQDQNEVVVAMRGVYSSSQQKILILLDGHRLNSRAYSMANPDHSIGLEKVQQIEIIRGPGSSAYGNVALTAVINIVLKKGSQLEGGEASLGVGDFGQRKLSLTLGRSLGDNGELVAWLEYFEADGEELTIRPEDDFARRPADRPVGAIIGGYREPSHDLGLKLHWKDLRLLLSHRVGFYHSPFSVAGLTGEAFDNNAFEPIDGVGPGLQSTSEHAEIAYRTSLGEHWTWENALSRDANVIEGTSIIDPSDGRYVGVGWFEDSYGFTSLLSRGYDRGDLVFGYQYDQFRVYDSVSPLGVGGRIVGELFSDENPVLRNGRENTHSTFFTWKHRIGERWISNVGFRYDKKDRLTGPHVADTNPRLALIYRPDEGTSLRISWASSFVDPPYWNRYSALPSFRGSVDLQPEHLDSFQITPSFTWAEGRAACTLNIFYNRLTDIVFRNNQAQADEPIYTNAGTLETIGIEQEWAYLGDGLSIRLNATWQRVEKSEAYPATDREIHNIPELMANLTIDRKLRGSLWAHLTVHYLGSRLSPVDINLNGVPVPDLFPGQGADFHDLDRRLPSTTLVHAGLSIDDLRGSGLGFDLRAYNLFDEQWKQGGSTLHPYPQEGRRLSAQLRYRW